MKVLDFGLVKSVAGESDEYSLATAAGLTPGTPAYMAPEMAMGEAVDGRADIYALGCVAYYLLTGQLVFEADTSLQMIVKHLQSDPVPPSRRTNAEYRLHWSGWSSPVWRRSRRIAQLVAGSSRAGCRLFRGSRGGRTRRDAGGMKNKRRGKMPSSQQTILERCRRWTSPRRRAHFRVVQRSGAPLLLPPLPCTANSCGTS